MLMKKECVCGQNLEFEQEDAPYINCPSCGRTVSDLFDAATAVMNPEPLPSGAVFARRSKAPPPIPRMKGLFVSVSDETKGPYSLKQIKAMYESGQLTMDTLCCHEGAERWRPLVELEREIFKSDQKAAPPPIPTRTPAARAIQFAQRQINEEKNNSKRNVWIAIVLSAGVVLFLILAAAGGGPVTDFDSKKQDAHYTAEQFIKQQIVGAKTVSDYRDSVVTSEGNTYYVAVNVDGLNAFGGPVRQALIVEMTLDGDKWRLVKIHHK